MIKLINRVEGLGLFGGELNVKIGIKRAFEGFSGHATETWETQYTFESDELTNDVSGMVIFPKLSMKSKPYESFEDFIRRVEERL